MKNYNPKLIVYILMLSTLALNTPLSIVGILVEISHYFNISLAIAGLFVSSFTFTIAITGIFTPSLFANFERKKLFESVLLIFVSCNFLTIFTDNLIIALLLRIISAVFYPVFISIALTVGDEIAPENEKQDYITKILLGISVGSIIGLPITTGIGTIFGFAYAMLWITIINLISLIGVIIIFPKMDATQKNIKSSYSQIISKNFLISVIGIIMLPIGISIIYNYMSYFLQTVTGIFTFNLSIILFIYGLISIVGTWVGGKLIVKSSKFTILSFPVISIIALILLSLFGELTIPAIILLLIIGFLDGEGYNIIQYFQVTLLSDSLELANGIFLSILNGGIAIGTAIGGFIVDELGVMSIFSLSVIPLAISLIIFYYLININDETEL